MARLCRAIDWSATPLGPVERWPEALATTCRLVLASPLSMILRWGPDLVQIYNDAYRTLLGAKHPRALGLPTRECWDEVWQKIAPIHFRVLNTGKAEYLEDQRYVIERHGYPEETFFTAGYTPVRLADGQVGGVLVSTFETTARMRAAEDARERTRAEGALRASEARFRSVVENSDDMLFRVDLRTGRYVYISPSARAVCGHSAEALLAMSMEEAVSLIHPQDLPAARAAIAALLTTGRQTIEYRYVTPAGDYRWLSNHTTLVRDDAGNLYRDGVVRDVTELKQAMAALEESEARFRTLFETMTEGFCLLHIVPDGQDRPCDARHLLVNPAFERLVGMNAADVIGRTLRQVDPAIEESAIQRYAQVALTGESAHFQARFGPTGRWFEISAYQAQPGFLATVFFDVTDRMRAQEAMREAKEAAEKANTTKTQFLSTLSHELRTPLNAVIGLADLVAMDVAGPTTDQQQEYLGRIKTSAWHLVSIIDEILTYSRTEAGKEQVRLAGTDVAAIARSVVALLADQAQASGLRLSYSGTDEPAHIVTDAAKVRQIVVNLVGNALKYTEGGSVEVVLQAEDGNVLLHVRDTGPGIPADRLEDIFEPFVQLDGSNTREHGGTGLGLTICRRLARLLSGDVVVASTPGEGSTFTVRIPGHRQADLVRH